MRSRVPASGHHPKKTFSDHPHRRDAGDVHRSAGPDHCRYRHAAYCQRSGGLINIPGLPQSTSSLRHRPADNRETDRHVRAEIFLHRRADNFYRGFPVVRLSNSMTLLIIFRGIQGIGGGWWWPMLLSLSATYFRLRSAVNSWLYQRRLATSSVLGPCWRYYYRCFSWHWVFSSIFPSDY